MTGARCGRLKPLSRAWRHGIWRDAVNPVSDRIVAQPACGSQAEGGSCRWDPVAV